MHFTKMAGIYPETVTTHLAGVLKLSHFDLGWGSSSRQEKGKVRTWLLSCESG